MYGVGHKQRLGPTDLSLNRFIRKKSTVVLHVHQLRNYSILYQVVCNFALLLVLNILWSSIVDTRMRRSSQSIHTVIEVTLYVIHLLSTHADRHVVDISVTVFCLFFCLSAEFW